MWVPLIGIVVLAMLALYVLDQKPTNLINASNEPDPMADERVVVADSAVAGLDGSTKRLSEFRGSVLVVTFWTAECSTCVVELPAFAELSKRYSENGLKVLAVNLDAAETGTKAAQDLWSRGQFPFPAFVDPERGLARAFGFETLPSNYVLDRKGRIAFSSTGANDWLGPETARLIEDLLLEAE